MEAIYIIMAMVLVVITNIYSTTVIADRYNIRDRSMFISLTSLLAFAILITSAGIITTAPLNGTIGFNFDLLSVGSVVLAWVVGLISFHSIKGFVRNFRKFLPGLSASTNKLIDKIVGVKDILFNRAKKRVVAELHKDEEEIKQLTAKLHNLEALLQFNQANQRAALTPAPVETPEPAKQLPSPATSPKKRRKPVGTGCTSGTTMP